MEEELIFILICIIKMLENRMQMLHYILFILSRYFEQLNKNILIKNVFVNSHFSLKSMLFGPKTSHRSTLSNHRQHLSMRKNDILSKNGNQLRKATKCGSIFIAVQSADRRQTESATKCGSISLLSSFNLELDWVSKKSLLNVLWF